MSEKDKEIRPEEELEQENEVTEAKDEQNQEPELSMQPIDREDDEEDEEARSQSSYVSAEQTKKPMSPAVPWTIAGLLAAALIALILVANPFEKEEAVATVNGEAISKDKLYDHMVSQNGTAALDELVTETLIHQEADKANLEATREDIDEELEVVKANFPSEEEFAAALEQYGMTQESLERQIVMQVLLRKLVAPQVDVTEEEVKSEFDTQKQQFTEPEQIRASHILVESEAKAKELLEQIRGGADFAQLAKENSTDGSAAQGGDLSYFGRGDMVPEFEEAAFALKKDEVSDVVKSQFGYHIIKVTDVPKDWTFEGKKEELEKQLRDAEVNTLIPEWVEKARADADIESKLEKA